MSTEDLDQIAAYRALLGSPVAAPPGLAGEGVIYSLYEADGRAHVGTQIGIRLLRELGWQGRIQLWHCGNFPDLAGLDVDLRDFRAVHAVHGGNWRGWASKGYALFHSGLARALVIDWDAYCVADPQPLFNLLDRYGMLYWCGCGPRTEGTWSYNPQIFHQLCDPVDIVGAIQGGFMLFDCRTFWRGIVLQRHYDDRAAWWWPRNRGVDEEGWRLSLSTLKPPALWSEPLEWRDPAWINWHEGTAYAVHRCNGKLWPDCVPRWNRALPKEARVQELFRELAPGYRQAAFGPCAHREPAKAGDWRRQKLRHERQRLLKG